jgi:hypothetical protein
MSSYLFQPGGGVIIGSASGTVPDGTVQYNGANFQGYKSGNWVNLDFITSASASGGVSVNNGAISVDNTVVRTSGNATGGAINIGTNDANSLSLITAGAQRLLIDNAGAISTSGNVTINNTTTYSTVSLLGNTLQGAAAQDGNGAVIALNYSAANNK